MNNLYSYLHIPFCENRCKYCRFASFWIYENEKITKYIEYLVDEINNFSKLNNFNFINNKTNNNLKSIYFWWWTPSTLNLDQISKLILTLKQKLIFSSDIEITLETTPNKIIKENLLWWQKLWINRLSIWVQTLNNRSLEEIWRGNKWDIIKAMDILNNYFINLCWAENNNNFNVSLDFIIWLPFVKRGEIKNNIKFILDKYKFVNHISVYMLEDQYYPNKWRYLWISEGEYLWEYVEIKIFLKHRWFYSYEISNFSKTWYECRHNKAYWNHSEILAFWLWSHGFLNSYRYENYDDFKSYYSWKIRCIEKLNKNDILLENVMFSLRTSWLKKEIYNKLNKEKIYYFIKNWYLKIENDILKIEDKWILVMDYILGEIV